MARAVVGGLLTSTCLTLFVVPILYTLLIREGTGQNEALEAELADNPVERASVLAADPLPETVLSQPSGMALIKSDGHPLPNADSSQDGNKPV